MKITKSQLKQIILDEGLFANIKGALSPEGEGTVEFDTSSPEFRELIYDLVQDVLKDMVQSDPMFLRKMGKTVHDVATGAGLYAKHPRQSTVREPTDPDATQVVRREPTFVER